MPRRPRGRPVAHGVGAVLLEHVLGRHDVALGLGHLLAVRVEDPAGDRRVLPRHARRARGAARTTVENSQVRMMSWPCGRRSNGKTFANSVVRRRRAQPPGDLRGQRRGGPGVHDVGVADEAAGHAALATRRSPAARRRRVDRQLVLGGHERLVVVRARRRSSSGYQTGNGTPKKRWRRDQPVAVEAARPSSRSASA